MASIGLGIAGIASSLVGGILGSNASNNAANQQSASQQQALQFAQQVWNQQQANQASYLSRGSASYHNLINAENNGQLSPGNLPSLGGLMQSINNGGVSYAPPGATTSASMAPPGQTTNANQAGVPSAYGYTPFNSNAGNVPQGGQNMPTLPAGFTAPTLQDAENTPGYQFQQQEGAKGILEASAATGGAISGGTSKALEQYNQGLAQTDYSNVFNQALQGYGANLQGYQAGLAGQNQAFNQQLASQGQAFGQGVTSYGTNLAGQQQNFNQANTNFSDVLAQQGQAYNQAQSNFGDVLAAQGQNYNQQFQTFGGNEAAQQQNVNEQQQGYQASLQNYQQKMAAIQQQYGMLFSQANLGEGAAASLGGEGSQTANNVGNIFGNIGNAQAAGTIGSANAWSGALSGGVNSATQAILLGKLFGN